MGYQYIHTHADVDAHSNMGQRMYSMPNERVCWLIHTRAAMLFVHMASAILFIKHKQIDRRRFRMARAHHSPSLNPK